ncbi:hypothetical protein ACJIZ3_017309 [Penstemon smallii]|uniref:Uncharacterized protein n=1 Tax=Penstemon smallii TaxID=265156 RepID=A0ABD3SVA4_9LAMI
MGESKVVFEMKLLINSQTKKVLFNILSLPMATAIYLYESLENLNETYIFNLTKTRMLSLLKPKISMASSVPLMFLEHAPTDQKSFYRCPNRCSSSCYSDSQTAVCTSCARQLTSPIYEKFVPSEEGGGGFVKGVVTYIIWLWMIWL